MIELRELQKVIEQKLVLDIEALTVRDGEVAALVGSTGSGKAALFALLTGQSRPTAGTVRLAGVDPLDKAAFSRRVGVLFPEEALYRRQSARANLAFYARLHNLPRARVEATLQAVGLADHANARLDQLPPGLLRRLAFGRAILHAPEALILNAPFEKCDEGSVALLSRLIQRAAEQGQAVLILTDDATHLAALCDTLYDLEQGRISERHTPQQAEEPRMPFKIPVKLEGRVALVNPGDILYATTREGRVLLQTTQEQLPTQFTLAELEERLGRSGFFRAHRSYLVNLQHVKEVIPYTRNSYSLCLNDAEETEIPLSKSAAGELRELLGY